MFFFCLISHVLLFVQILFNRLDLLSCFMNILTICISEYFSFRYGVDSGSFLKAVLKPVEVYIRL